MKNVRFASPAVIAVITALTGCLSFTGEMAPGSSPAPDRAYLFGGFTMSNYYRKALVLELVNTDTGETRWIQFSGHPGRENRSGVTVIEVEPGTYRFREFIACPAVRALFTIEKSDCSERRPFSCGERPGIESPFTVEKGKAYYIGEIRGISYGRNGGREIAWEIESVTDDFEASVARLRGVFPAFQSIPAARSFGP